MFSQKNFRSVFMGYQNKFQPTLEGVAIEGVGGLGFSFLTSTKNLNDFGPLAAASFFA